VFVRHRTPNSYALRVPGQDSTSETEALVKALKEVGLDQPSSSAEGSRDLLGDQLVQLPGGEQLALQIRVASRPDLAHAQRLVAGSENRVPSAAVKVLVADAIPGSVRSVLKDAGWGFLDRRGHLRLQAAGLLIDADVQPTTAERLQTREPLRGAAGRAYASAILLDRHHPPGVRAVARLVGMSASAVSDAARLLRDASLVEKDGRPLVPDLFWALAEVWKPRFVPLAVRPDQQQLTISMLGGINVDHPDEPGWAATGTVAAVALGAPVAATAVQPVDFYVPDETALRRATLLLGRATSWETRGCALAVAPTPLACIERQEPASGPFDEWPLTRPLFVALELAQDKARGREVLDQWTPSGDLRVW
jgi:hypothetical protein